MGKKVKAIMVDSSLQSQVNANTTLEDTSSTETTSISSCMDANDIVSITSKTITADIQKKLDDYDRAVAQNTTLLAEKADLESKIASYIEEIRTMKTESLPGNANDSCELAAAQKEINSLKSSVAQYLRRISDLTFENATLNAQLKELSTKSAQVQNTIPSMPVRDTRLEKPVYNPYKHNGYASWN